MSRPGKVRHLDNDHNSSLDLSNLFTSISVAFIVSMIATNYMGTQLVEPMIRDGSIIVESRYTITHDALDSIEDDGVDSIVALGSSMTFKGLDGGCVGNSIENNAKIYNLAMPMSMPYDDMIHMPKIVQARPDIVMIEVGPNLLTNISKVHAEYTQFRYKLDSMQQEERDLGRWTEIILPEHREWVALNEYQRNSFRQEYVSEALEESLRRLLLNESRARQTWAVAPQTGSANWMDYLQSPDMPSDLYGFEGMNTSERNEYNSTKMSGSAGYSPSAFGTVNHAALDYEIQTLLDNDIKIIITSLPQHPDAINLVPNGKWDGYNATINRYANISGIIIFDQLWDNGWNDEHFYDRNHLDDEGRIEFCHRLAPVIDELLNEG